MAPTAKQYREMIRKIKIRVIEDLNWFTWFLIDSVDDHSNQNNDMTPE